MKFEIIKRGALNANNLLSVDDVEKNYGKGILQYEIPGGYLEIGLQDDLHAYEADKRYSRKFIDDPNTNFIWATMSDKLDEDGRAIGDTAFYSNCWGFDGELNEVVNAVNSNLKILGTKENMNKENLKINLSFAESGEDIGDFEGKELEHVLSFNFGISIDELMAKLETEEKVSLFYKDDNTEVYCKRA